MVSFIQMICVLFKGHFQSECLLLSMIRLLPHVCSWHKYSNCRRCMGTTGNMWSNHQPFGHWEAVEGGSCLSLRPPSRATGSFRPRIPEGLEINSVQTTLWHEIVAKPTVREFLIRNYWGMLGPRNLLERKTFEAGVAPANQTEGSEVRKLPGKESGICSGTPFFGGFGKHLQAKGGSGTSSGLLPRKFANLTFFGSVCRSYSWLKESRVNP